MVVLSPLKQPQENANSVVFWVISIIPYINIYYTSTTRLLLFRTCFIPANLPFVSLDPLKAEPQEVFWGSFDTDPQKVWLED